VGTPSFIAIATSSGIVLYVVYPWHMIAELCLESKDSFSVSLKVWPRKEYVKRFLGNVVSFFWLFEGKGGTVDDQWMDEASVTRFQHFLARTSRYKSSSLGSSRELFVYDAYHQFHSVSPSIWRTTQWRSGTGRSCLCSATWCIWMMVWFSFFIMQMRKLRLCEVKGLVQNHTWNPWQGQY
jgi:hypothetical protein